MAGETDKRTYELEEIVTNSITTSHYIECDKLGNSEAEKVQIGTLLSGRSYIIPITDWSLQANRHKIIPNIPNVAFHIDSITILDDDGNEHIGSSIFDLKLAGEYGAFIQKRTPEGFQHNWFMQPSTFGVRAHTIVDGGVKYIKLMHDYPVRIDSWTSTPTSYGLRGLDGNLTAGMKQFKIDSFDTFIEPWIPKIGWVLQDSAQTYFPAGTIIENVYLETYGVVNVLGELLPLQRFVITTNNALKINTIAPLALSFRAQSRPYWDSMKYGLECESGLAIPTNVEGNGLFPLQAGHLTNFASSTGARGYVKITIPFVE